jgi:hypothetical protein
VVKDRNGNSLLDGNLDAALFGGGLSVVTPKKFLGAKPARAQLSRRREVHAVHDGSVLQGRADRQSEQRGS